MKKVAFIINSNKLGGAEKVVYTLINNLINDFEIHLILLERNDFFKVNELNSLKVHYLSESDGLKNNVLKFFDLIPLAFKLKQYLLENDIKVVQSNLYRSNYINILAKLFRSKHETQIVDHTLSYRLKKEGASGAINRILVKMLYKYADVSISVSKLVQKQLLTETKLPLKRYVINNPFNIKEIEQKSIENITDFQFRSNKFYIILVGRINTIKNYQLVIGALNILDNQNIHLIIIGKEEDISVNELVIQAKYKEIIHYLGEKSNPFSYIKKCDLLVVSSNSESFGNVLVESMICNTPVISSDCGGPREILDPYTYKDIFCQPRDCFEKAEYGLLFPVNNAVELSKCIELLINDEELKKNYISKSKKRASDFSIEKVVSKYKKVINNA